MKLIHFADLHLGVESYGHINPETGLSSRLEDFLIALDQVIDFAISNNVDLVLFCGDAYKTREPSQTQQRELAKRLKRLSEAGVPLFMVIGNHDLPNAVGRATALEIFDTLSVPGVYIANRPGIQRVQTKNGEIQVAALPWLSRNALLRKEDARNLDFNQINERLQQVLTRIIADQAGQINPDLPAVLASHVWVLNASLGTEKAMSIGQEHMLLLSSVALLAFDYVALGHIHKGQILNEAPPVVYSGSLERVDFGDEGDEKGFYLVEISPDQTAGKRQVKYEFHSIQARPFLTVRVEIGESEIDPTRSVVATIQPNLEKIKGAIVRLEINLSAAQASRLSDQEFMPLLKDAHYLTVAKVTKRETRVRLGGRAMEQITPGEALKIWLESKYPADKARLIFEYGEKLIQSQNNRE